MAKKKNVTTTNNTMMTQSIDGSNVIFSLNGKAMLRIPRNCCKTIAIDENKHVVRFKVHNIQKWALFSGDSFYLRTSPLVIARLCTKVGTKQKVIVKKLLEE